MEGPRGPPAAGGWGVRTGAPPPLDLECEYLLSPQLHFPSFVSPFILGETLEQLLRLLQLLQQPQQLRANKALLAFALQLARAFDSTALLEALSPRDHLLLILGWKR
ncbi:hypothetical protein ETH_00025285, partial [Eimeria tenella]